MPIPLVLFVVMMNLDVVTLGAEIATKPTPMLVLGADDFIVRAGQVQATARAYGLEAGIFPEMGHAMMLESGWQAVADRVIDWLAAQGL